MAHSPRVAVITGASQGIGAGLVVGYRKLGYAVVANSRTITAGDDPMVLTVDGDISQPGVGQQIIDAGLQHFGRVDTVVNNAGIFIAKPFTDYTDADYDAITGSTCAASSSSPAPARPRSNLRATAAMCWSSPPAWLIAPIQRCRQRWPH